MWQTLHDGTKYVFWLVSCDNASLWLADVRLWTRPLTAPLSGPKSPLMPSEWRGKNIFFKLMSSLHNSLYNIILSQPPVSLSLPGPLLHYLHIPVSSQLRDPEPPVTCDQREPSHRSGHRAPLGAAVTTPVSCDEYHQKHQKKLQKLLQI